MGLIASDTGGKDYDPIPAGVTHGVCWMVCDLGTQYNPTYANWQRKIVIGWELPSELMQIEKDGEMAEVPKVISRIFTLSLSEKSHLRPFLESWRGKPFTVEELIGFDISKLIQVNCQLNIIHVTKNEKTYANVAGVMPLAKQTAKLKCVADTVYYSMDDHGLFIPENVPDWLKSYIMKSREYNETGQQNEGPTGLDEPPVPDDDDIPF